MKFHERRNFSFHFNVASFLKVKRTGWEMVSDPFIFFPASCFNARRRPIQLNQKVGWASSRDNRWF